MQHSCLIGKVNCGKKKKCKVLFQLLTKSLTNFYLVIYFVKTEKTQQNFTDNYLTYFHKLNSC